MLSNVQGTETAQAQVKKRWQCLRTSRKSIEHLRRPAGRVVSEKLFILHCHVTYVASLKLRMSIHSPCQAAQRLLRSKSHIDRFFSANIAPIFSFTVASRVCTYLRLLVFLWPGVNDLTDRPESLSGLHSAYPSQTQTEAPPPRRPKLHAPRPGIHKLRAPATRRPRSGPAWFPPHQNQAAAPRAPTPSPTAGHARTPRPGVSFSAPVAAPGLLLCARRI